MRPWPQVLTCFARMQPVAMLAVQAMFAMVQCGLEVATEYKFKITSDRPHPFGEMPRALHALRQKVYRYRHQQLEQEVGTQLPVSAVLEAINTPMPGELEA